MAVEQSMAQRISVSSALMNCKIERMIGMSGNGMAGNGMSRKPDLSISLETIFEKIEK